MESIKAQYTEVIQKRSEIDEAQKPLLIEMNEIKAEIGSFDDKRKAVVVSCQS